MLTEQHKIVIAHYSNLLREYVYSNRGDYSNTCYNDEFKTLLNKLVLDLTEVTLNAKEKHNAN